MILSSGGTLDEADMILNKGGPHLDPPSDDEDQPEEESGEPLDPENVFWRYPHELKESIQVSAPPFPFLSPTITPHFFRALC